MGIIRNLLLTLILSVVSTAACYSAEIHGRSSTQFMFFNNELIERRQVQFAEYLRLGITNIDNEGKFNIYGYGRLNQDLNAGEGGGGRLYYLYGDYRDLYGKIDFRLGRQFVNLAAGSAIIDGALVTLKNVGPVAFTVLGGRDVIFGETGELGAGRNTALGLAANLVDFQKTDLELSWFRKWDQGDVSRDQIGAAFKQYLFNSLRLYGNTRFDLATETFNELQAGVKYFPQSNLIFTAEWFQSYPTFDYTSIYSVFAVDRYQEGIFRIDYTFNEMVSVNAGYNRQFYDEGATADVYHVGIGFRPIEHFKLGVEYDKRHGYYGSTNGFIADALYELGTATEISGGINYDVYQRDSLTNDEIARRYWLGGKYKIARNMVVSGRIQNDVNIHYKENISGRLAFDYDF